MCYRPITLKKREAVVPCGKCPQCINRRIASWSFRLMQEERVSTSAYFITLTYDTRYVPIASNGRLTLCKRDLQLFFKRLRKSQCGNGISPIKYYAVGEYGGRTFRPHYHIILFNAELELIQDAWRLGSIFNGSAGVTGASVGYTLKYMSKQKRLRCPDGLQREFSLMSKGLGVSYLNEVNCKWHAADLLNRMYCVLQGGVKVSMPRYYKDKMYFDLERAAIAEAQAIIANNKQLEKLEKFTARDFRNEQAAIDAAFDKMYLKSLKQKL